MRYLVFSQAQKEPPQEAVLVQKARTFFQTDLHFTQRWLREATPQEGDFRVRVALPGHSPVELSLTRRDAAEEDWCAAEEAERAGQATGMSTLARRCRVVWEIPAIKDLDAEILTLCGVLAATELGPVMPPDRSTLYGVRGARLRAESARQERQP